MNNNNNLDTAQLQDFIADSSGSIEVGLIIAENTEELESFSKLLERFGLGKLSSVLKYKNVGHGWYIVANRENSKEIYDFVCQYPLTIISLFDSETANTVVLNPDYQHPTFVLVEQDTLHTIQKSLDLLGRAGAAYRAK